MRRDGRAHDSHFECASRDEGPPVRQRGLQRVASNRVAAVDTAIVAAAVFTRAGHPEAGARVCDEALAQAGPGPAGWILPIEPTLHVTAHRDAWARTLATLADRAV